MLRLEKPYGKERLEAACHRARALGTLSYRSVESILRHHLDAQPLQEDTPDPLPRTHENLRGPDYYH